MPHDVIIIGSGLGGLVAGAKLAKEGRDVLVIEQHSSVGGYATCFTQENFTIDVGLHSMEGLYIDDPKIKVFEDLEVYFNLEFIKIPKTFFRFTNSRMDFTIPNSAKEAKMLLSELFPEDRRGINAFFDDIDDFLSPKWRNLTAGEMLDSFFSNDDLKLALSGTIMYYGDDPYTLSAVSYAAALSRNFKGGNHYIKGGSVKLSDYFANFIKERGGRILVNTKVTKILLNPDNNAVEGVEYITLGENETEPSKVQAKHVVANASVPTVAELLPHENQIVQELQEAIKHLKVGHSVLNVYLGFNTTLDKLGHTDYLTVVNDESVFSLGDLLGNTRGDYTKKNFIFVNYGQIDSGMAPFGKSTGVISTVDFIENWAYLSAEDYKLKKEEIGAIFIERLNKLIPNIDVNIEYVNVATPKTMEKYTLNPKGSAIGFARTPLQLRMYPLTSPIKNLHFASAWSIPGGGFTSIIDAGWECALNILKRRR